MVNVGALLAIDDITATSATGNIYGYSAQLIGNNLYSKRNINVFNATYQTTPTFHGYHLAYRLLFARAENGPRMPLALIKARVKGFRARRCVGHAAGA